jgi:hypothetical protein
MKHPKLSIWEKRLGTVLRRIDETLEARYGHRYPLHPSRPPHGTTANPKYSGLFQVDAAFTPGFGSRYGRGYLLEVRMVTLSQVPHPEREALEHEVVGMLRRELARSFPERQLQVLRDGDLYKIIGDLSLGSL